MVWARREHNASTLRPWFFVQMTPRGALRNRVRAAGLALIFGLAFGLAGIVGGFILGMEMGPSYEDGPLLMLFTGPLAALVGVAFGVWKGLTVRDEPRFNEPVV